MLHLKNATVYTMEKEGILQNCDIVIENGKIKEVGYNLTCVGAEVIDASGKVIIPGIIDAHSHVGTDDVMKGTSECNEMTNPSKPDLDIYYGIDPDNLSFKHCLQTGITTSIVCPGSGNALGGISLAMKSYGKDFDSRIIKKPCALKAAMGINPKGAYGSREQFPMSRIGVAQLFIDFFENVKDYMKKKEEANGDKEKMPPYDKGLEHGQLVLEGKIPLKVHSYQHDMMALLRWQKEYGFKLTLDHAFGASDFYDEIEEAVKNGPGLHVIWGPESGPLFGGEGCKNDPECVIELSKRGVNCAIMTDGTVLHPYMIITTAGEVVRRGGKVEEVLKMITINAAKVAMAEDRIGSIKVGKDADILIFEGTPALDTDAKVLYTIVDGEIAYKA